MRLIAAASLTAAVLASASPAFADDGPAAADAKPDAKVDAQAGAKADAQAGAKADAAAEAKADAKVAAPPKAVAGDAPRPAETAVPAANDELTFSDRLVLDTGRHDFRPPNPEALTFSLRGEYQLRYRAMSDLALEAPVRHPEAKTLGQNQYLYHWLRIGARFQYRDKVGIVAQIDIPRGFVVGDATQYVSAVRDSFAENTGRDGFADVRWYGVRPRYLYLEYNSPIGVFRLGQQGSYWGMGLLANDGDHPTLFGDYQRGALSERILYATQPLGKGTPLNIVLAGDLIFQDNTADLVEDGDRALQGVAAVLYRDKHAEAGLYGVIRQQQRTAHATGDLTPFTESLTVGVIDGAGKFNAPIPGLRAIVYGQIEAALIMGSTTYLRNTYAVPIDPTAPRETEKIRSFGAAATFGAVQVAGHGADQWGALVGEIEAGYASGDANPNDGTTRRFTFDQNHRVGLVLFNQVMAWKTARASTIAQDPEIVNRATPGVQLLPSRGGVFGAEYLNPRFIFRPRNWMDLKGGVVIAQTTADFVDPYHVGALGSSRNYDGGDPRKHDLGVELDAGADVRIKVEKAATVQVGAEGGVLFPGHAFDDALGARLANQYLANVKLGIQF
ncbi:MAG: hypothetical protein U0359_41985 [Byssovorax sp.]